MTTYEIQGRSVTLPVEVRHATSWAAMFLVPARAAQRIIGQTGLEVAEPLPRRTLVTLAFVRYDDGDLDSYNELAVTYLVRRHDVSRPGALGRVIEVARRQIGVYIRHLPVDRTFTLEAGRTIWGYPKFLADIRIDERDDGATCTLTHEGARVLTLTVAPGRVRVPGGTPPTYSDADGVLRLTPWAIDADTRGGPGGARLALGEHAIADELRSLGLPRKALMTTRVRDLRARFGPATVVRSAVQAP